MLTIILITYLEFKSYPLRFFVASNQLKFYSFLTNVHFLLQNMYLNALNRLVNICSKQNFAHQETDSSICL